jgi:endonuclease III
MSGSASGVNERVRELLAEHGSTYAEEAGIKLADKPAPLYELLVLAMLLSARISANIAVAAARELFAAGYRTPAAMADASWQDRVDALGRGHYKRYDERTATMLGDGAGQVLRDWHGDLRALRDKAGGGAAAIAGLLTEFPGIGPAGASVFLREVQEIWPSVAPYVDDRMAEGARRAALPDDRDALAALLEESGQPARLAAALIRMSLKGRTFEKERN